jgi:hypothetical protein
VREIHFFDLDSTLIDVESYVWIIDKEKPNIPLGKIGNIEFSLIQNNIYKKDNLLVDYNDEKFFISKELFNKINKKKKLPIERIGFSFREWKDRKYINSNKITFLAKNVKHLVGKNVKVSFLTARSNRKKHGTLLNGLRLILKRFGLSIYKIYFVGDKFEVYHKEYLSHRKSVILLEHLIGLKIEDNKFISFKQDKFDKVHFYDDAKINIDSSNDIQILFTEIYTNSDDKIKEEVLKILEDKPTLYTNFISTNEVNPFETKVVVLNTPIKYPIIESIVIKKFKDFGLNS